MTNNQLAENSVNQLLNSVRLARDNAERADNRVDHSFYYALTIALEELQERRKADSEPVILYRERNPYNGLTTGWQELTENELSFLKENAGENAEFLKLYRHAQQPVVPEEITSASAPEVFEIAAEAERLGLRGTYASYAVGWNACRAAMLQAEPVTTANKLGNSPVIPDGYVMVPEILDYQGAKELYNYLMTEEETNATVNGWNACRAAMLPGKSE